MRQYLSIFVLLMARCVAAPAGELLVSGHVEKVVDCLNGSAGCPAACPPDSTEGAVSRRVCVSNACGTETADIRVDKVFAGSDAGKVLHIETPIGESCKAVFAVSAQPVLVQLGAGQPRWSPIIDRDGKAYVKAAAFGSVGGIAVAALPADADGLVALDQLLTSLAQKAR
jgi:hypothetical protein